MVILYGGSYNPPTVAHFKIAQKLIDKYKPNAFIFIPVGNVYNKENLINFTHRYNMLKFFTQKLKNTQISTLENETKDFQGTIYTLDYYQKLYPNDEIYYVIGADNLKTLHTWKNYQDLIKNFNFIVLNRNKIDIKQLLDDSDYKDHFIIESDFEPINISSTDYRESFNDQVVLEEINQYIYKHNLYNRGGENEK